MKSMISCILLALNVSAFADCTVSINVNGPSGPMLDETSLTNIVSKKLASKGYALNQHGNSQYELEVNYIGGIPAPAIVGTAVKFSELNNDIIIAKNEQQASSFDLLFRSEKSIAKRTLTKSLKKMLKEIPSCN